MGAESEPSVDGVARREAGQAESVAAGRRWWDASADEYQAEHGAFLRDDGFIWCPEGLDEAEAGLLGEVAGRDVLEIGCGAAQCARWLIGRGARTAAIDLSRRQLQHARRIDDALGTSVPLAQADATLLPFASGSFDIACSAYGALPFVADAGAVLAETARVVRRGGRFVFSVSHPIRWAFPDGPGAEGLTVENSYFDRRAYVEYDAAGRATYTEHHRTAGDWVRLINATGWRLAGLVEPEWPEDLTEEWGGWSPLRGRLIPGTAIFTCVRTP